MEGTTMTINKAKLYKTAVIENPIEGSGLVKGDVVSVKFVGRGAFGLNFLIEADYLGVLPMTVSEHDLTNFVL